MNTKENTLEGHIYRIKCNKTGKLYFGSTTVGMPTRMAVHRYHYDKYHNDPKFNPSVFQVLEGGDYVIDVIQTMTADSMEVLKHNLAVLERHYIKNTENCINTSIPMRTMKEYYQDNKEHLKAYGKQYYQENKEAVNLKNKKRYWKQKIALLAEELTELDPEGMDYKAVSESLKRCEGKLNNLLQ